MSSKCCLESFSQIASEAIREVLNSKFSWGAHPQTPLVGSHTFARYYHPATILFPPQLKILYENLQSTISKLASLSCTQRCSSSISVGFIKTTFCTKGFFKTSFSLQGGAGHELLIERLVSTPPYPKHLVCSVQTLYVGIWKCDQGNPFCGGCKGDVAPLSHTCM